MGSLALLWATLCFASFNVCPHPECHQSLTGTRMCRMCRSPTNPLSPAQAPPPPPPPAFPVAFSPAINTCICPPHLPLSAFFLPSPSVPSIVVFQSLKRTQSHRIEPSPAQHQPHAVKGLEVGDYIQDGCQPQQEGQAAKGAKPAAADHTHPGIGRVPDAVAGRCARLPPPPL